MRYFGDQSSEEMADSLTRWLPPGAAFAQAGKPGSVLHSLIRALSLYGLRAESQLNDEMDQRITVGAERDVARWEKALGIPDGVYPVANTLAVRGNYVLAKLSERFTVTEPDIAWFASLFGLTVTVRHGTNVGLLPMTLPGVLFASLTEARNTIVIDYGVGVAGGLPYTLPMTFEPTSRSTFEAAMRRLIPVTHRLLTIYTV